MNLITLDWETYYDAEYSLSRMSTEEYVCDPRFQIMMVGIKVNDEAAYWRSYGTIEAYRTALDEAAVAHNAMIAHHTAFDALILQHHFDIIPPLLLDTLGMAQAILKPTNRSISLANCLKVLQLGVQKGKYVHNMKGRRLESLTMDELTAYGQYCIDDCEGEYALFQHLVKQLPRQELQIIDMTLRMYLKPQFEADYRTFKNVYDHEVTKKAALIAQLPEDILPTQLSSNPQLAVLLEGLGVEVPMKVSPTTDKPTYAFAKEDTGWKDLEDEYMDDPLVAPILAARLGIKSTLAESRAQRLMGIADKFGALRVPLRYYAAHTGRYGGMEKINCQNLTRIDPKNPSRSQLRYGLKAPDGYSVLVADLSQIEARINAWLSGCEQLLEIFRDGGDPYCEFASKAFHRPITKADERERFIGKTCILGLGYGMGWKKLRATLRKDGIKINERQARDLVDVYRYEYREIRDNWRVCDSIIELVAHGGTQVFGPCRAEYQKVVLPNNMSISYPNLRHIESNKYTGWTYDFAGQGRTLWGGKFVENVIQSLARIIIVDNMCQARNKLGLHPALQAHDELVYVVPTLEVPRHDAALLALMKIPPAFAPDLPVDAETGHGPTYGDAK